MTMWISYSDRVGGRPGAGALAVLALIVLSGLAGCKGGGAPKGVSNDPILRLSAEESLAEGKRLMEAKKYLRATKYLDHAFEIAPNSATGREALLLSADALYDSGGETNFIKAESKYRDYQNRFPTSSRSDYVQLQLAKSLGERVLKPDRDQTSTMKALEEFRELIYVYPTSEYLDEARVEIEALLDRLAEHELIIGRYNYRRRLYPAAIARLEELLEDYPNFSRTDRALNYLWLAYRRMGEMEKAAEVMARLESEYPDSVYLPKLRQKEEKGFAQKKR